MTLIKVNLKHLGYDELNDVIEWALKHRKERLGEEELRLIKQKETLEQKLKHLNELDQKENEF
ncbi:hypothetical protein LJC57_00460 [Parabacteroides sp. OttesenSCG-928-G07]|nr:hypothetical protein [Parabacteroides sp. OttesenSCG-928-G21]MDL2277042.1 hypothetical protein [Parabacteroides sp. OttesenSCG-928-G07]